MMSYGSLQSELIETKYNSRIHRYGTSIFDKIDINIPKSINSDDQLLWGL